MVSGKIAESRWYMSPGCSTIAESAFAADWLLFVEPQLNITIAGIKINLIIFYIL
jgi:hypothetical protein